MQIELFRKKLARIISDIFIPPTFSFMMSIYLPLKFSHNSKEFLINFLILFLTSVLIPILFFIFLRRRGEIINRDAVIKEERTPLYFMVIPLYSLGYVITAVLNSNIFIQIYFLIYVFSTVGVIFINRNFKISIHSMTPAGTSALLLFINPYLSMVILCLTFLIMWSRLKLGVHTLQEVISGMLYGFCLTFLITILVLKYAT